MPLTRTQSQHHGHRVTYVELLFDLVFVFGITQLSHLLIKDFSLAGLGIASFLLLTIWWVWIFTAWVTNWLDPEQLPVRGLLLVLTMAGLVLSAAVPLASSSRGLVFASAYVLMQVGRTAFVVWTVRGEDSRMAHSFRRILAWFCLAAVPWIGGGLAEGGTRWALWGLALALEFASPWVGFWVPGLGRSTPKDWVVEGRHMAERCALFVMIALGESILVAGAAFANLQWTGPTIAAFVSSLLGAIAMWWLYFATTADAGGRHVSLSGDPARLARLAYTYIHILLVAGIVVSAVGDGLTLAHPLEPADAKTALAVLGGTALYLAGIVLFQWSVVGRASRTHLAAIAVLALVATATDHLTPLALMTASTVVLVVLVFVEERGKASTTGHNASRRIVSREESPPGRLAMEMSGRATPIARDETY
jgi:low temperature requirement protein LtrA